MQTIVNLGTGGADLNGQNGSTTSADSNDALFLDWPGDSGGNYVYLPGAAGNYLSVPDEAALDITGDIDIRVRVALDDWTPQTFLLSKWGGAGNRSYYLILRDTGVLRFVWSADGTNNAALKESTVAPTISDSEELWVRATLDVDNGASGNDVKFYTSADGLAWSQLGATLTTAGTTSIHAGSAVCEVGSGTNGTVALSAGKFYRAQVLDGIDGTPVLDVDCSQITSGSATSFTALTGQTVTINRSTSGRKSVAVVSPVWLFGTDDYMQVADNALLDFKDDQDFTIVFVRRWWNNPTYSVIMLKSNDILSAGRDGWSIGQNNATDDVFAQVYDGSNAAAVFVDTTIGGTNIVAFVRDTTVNEFRAYVDGVFDSTTTDNSTDLSTTNAVHIGRTNIATSRYTDMEMFAAAIFRRVLTAGEIASISSYYANKVA